MPRPLTPSYICTKWRSLCMFYRSLPCTNSSCKKYHITSRHDYQLGYTRRRRHLGLLFHYWSCYMRYRISSMWMIKKRRWRNIHLTLEVTIHMTCIVLWKTMKWEYSLPGYTGNFIGQKTHGDIFMTYLDFWASLPHCGMVTEVAWSIISESIKRKGKHMNLWQG